MLCIKGWPLNLGIYNLWKYMLYNTKTQQQQKNIDMDVAGKAISGISWQAHESIILFGIE